MQANREIYCAIAAIRNVTLFRGQKKGHVKHNFHCPINNVNYVVKYTQMCCGRMLLSIVHGRLAEGRSLGFKGL